MPCAHSLQLWSEVLEKLLAWCQVTRHTALAVGSPAGVLLSFCLSFLPGSPFDKDLLVLWERKKNLTQEGKRRIKNQILTVLVFLFKL